MTNKIIVTCFFVLIYMTSTAQSISWNIKRVETYNRTAKKETALQPTFGSLFIDFHNHWVVIRGDKNIYTVSFNDIEKNTSFSDSSCSYELTWVSIPNRNESITLTYTAGRLFDFNSDCVVIYSTSSFVKTFYLNKKDTLTESINFLASLEKKFDETIFDWKKIAEGADGTLWFVYKEPASKIKNDSEVKIWIKQLFKSFKYKGVSYVNAEAKVLMSFNCNEKRLYTEEAHYYNSKGNIILNENDTYNGWENVIPESIGEEVLNKVCKKFSL